MKSKKNVQEVVQTEHPEFVEQVQGLSVQDLDARLASIAKDIESVQEAKEADQELQETRNKAKELNAPYRESLAVCRLKSKYIVALIKEKGGA